MSVIMSSYGNRTRLLLLLTCLGQASLSSVSPNPAVVLSPTIRHSSLITILKGGGDAGWSDLSSKAWTPYVEFERGGDGRGCHGSVGEHQVAFAAASLALGRGIVACSSRSGRALICRKGGHGVPSKREGRRASLLELRCLDWETYNTIDDNEDDDEKPPIWKRPYLFLKGSKEKYKYSRESIKSARLPKEPQVTRCACGSGQPYSRCCERFHSTGRSPEDPVDLIRARYSAFAYRLPGYLIRTTHTSGPEFVDNTVKWEKELLKFCDQYKFKRLSGEELGLEVQECTYSGPDVAYVQFRAMMLVGFREQVDVLERSRLVRIGSQWFYSKGTLLEWDGPLL